MDLDFGSGQGQLKGILYAFLCSINPDFAGAEGVGAAAACACAGGIDVGDIEIPAAVGQDGLRHIQLA